jgi:hypothetical protein
MEEELESFMIPHEVLARLAGFLDDPMDRLNLALTCKTHKDRLLDGTNAAHTFNDVPFDLLAKHGRWDMLLFRRYKSLSLRDSKFILMAPSAPERMVLKAYKFIQLADPELHRFLENLIHHPDDGQLVSLDGPGCTVDESLSIAMATSIRHGKESLLGRLFSFRVSSRSTYGFTLTRPFRNNEECWSIIIGFDLLHVYEYLVEHYGDYFVRMLHIRDVGPNLLPVLCTVPHANVYLKYQGLVAGHLTIGDIDPEVTSRRRLIALSSADGRLDFLEQIASAFPSEVVMSEIDQTIPCQVDLEHPHLCLAVSKTREEVEAVWDEAGSQFSLEVILAVTDYYPSELAEVLQSKIGYEMQRANMLHAITWSAFRLNALWVPEFAQDEEILLALETNYRLHQKLFFKFIRRFDPEVLRGVRGRRMDNFKFRLAYSAVMRQLD